MSIMKKSGAALLALGLVGFLPTEALAKRVNVTAQAAAVKGDKGATLKAVKREARRKAVEQGAGVLVNSNTIVRNYQMVSDEIATSATGVITNEQFGKMSEKDGVATISLTADVSPTAVEDAICSVIKANHDPRIAFVFVETRREQSKSFDSIGSSSRGPIEGMLREALLSNCFTIVESGVKVTELGAGGNIPKEFIDAAVKNANAQYILVGTGNIVRSNAIKSIAADGVYTFQAAASLQLVNVDTFEVEATASTTVNFPGINFESGMNNNWKTGRANDYGKVVKMNRKGKPQYYVKDLFKNRLMDQLFTALSKRWTDDMLNTSTVSVEVKNVKKFKYLKALKAVTTSTLTGSVIQNPKLRHGKATMMVSGVDCGADAFAEKLEGKKVMGMTVEVSEVSNCKVILELTK